MKPSIRLSIIAALLAVTGCSTTSYCEGEFAYQTAPTMPPLQPADGVVVTESPSALRIPPPPATAVAYAEPFKDEDGDDDYRCLDRPPAMPALAPEAKPAEAAPAAVAPAAQPAAPAAEPPVPPPPK